MIKSPRQLCFSLSTIFLSLTLMAVQSQVDFAIVRTLYRKALTAENQIEPLVNATKAQINIDPLAKAYHATALALRARASNSPPTKISLANQAHQNLNQAASQQPNNLEIRFLRYSFEYGTPSFLGMKENMVQDKPMALSFARSKSPIKDIAVAFFQKCSEITEAEKRALTRP